MANNDDIRDGWQFRFVSEYGPTTGRVQQVGDGIPLRVHRENIPIGSNAGTLQNPLTVTGPYLKVELGAPADLTDYTFTGKIKVFRKPREFSRDINDVTNNKAVEVADIDLSAVLFVAATGTITTIPTAQLVDGETLTLNDGVNPATVFELDITGTNVPAPGNVEIDLSGDTTADQVRDSIVSAINAEGAGLAITASPGGAATVDLINDATGVVGNQALVDTVVDTGFVVSGMAGGSTLARQEYLEDQTFLDQGSLGNPGDVWYYTIFYEFTVISLATDQWIFSPTNSHARNWPNVNELDAAGDPVSKHGRVMFGRQPRSVKILDFQEANDTTYRFLQVLGRVFDGLGEELNQQLVNFANVDDVDAGRLPFLDWLLAWPTNYELPEVKRRVETKNAALLWKSKGTKSAMELALQTVTGWNVEIVEGYPWVLRTYDGREKLDATTQPVDWNEPTDGVWADLVNGVPDNTLFDASNPLHGTRQGTRKDKVTYTFSNEILAPTGVGWWWQNPNGLLIILREVVGVSQALSETLIRKIYRIAPLFALHYAAFIVQVEQESQETWQPLGADYYEDLFSYLNSESWQPFDSGSEYAKDETDLCTLHTYPHPQHPHLSTLNNPQFKTWHSWLILDCVFPIVTELGDNLSTEGGDQFIK